MYVQPLEGSFATGSLSSLPGALSDETPLSDDAAGAAAGDNISRFMPPWLNDGAAAAPYGALGPLMGMLQQLMQMLQSLLGCAGGNGCGSERFFRNATGSSDGDPHLFFNGNRWTSMASQPDLLSSGSFPGGFQISTQTSPPNGKGVTWNRSATVAMNGGATTVTMNANGQPAIANNGQTLSIAPGQTLQLGNGEAVTCEQNGALCITAQNGSGGQITTTLTARGNGVDVDVEARDVDLGGTLVNGSRAFFPSG